MELAYVTSRRFRRCSNSEDSAHDLNTCEKYRDTRLVSIAILVQKYGLFLFVSSIYTTHFINDARAIRIAMVLLRKRGGVQKSMGNKVPWKTGVLIYLPVTSRPLISLQKEAALSPCNFATAHLTACILNFYLP